DNFCKTKVYLIDRAELILTFKDEDISELVSYNNVKKLVTIHHTSSLKRLEVVNGEVEYEIEHADGATEVIHVEKALISIGRTPNIESLKIENAEIGRASCRERV